MTATISKIQNALHEQQHLLSVLDMWEKVKQQGIDPESVNSFGFNPELMTATDRNQARKESKKSYGDVTKQNPFGWPTMERSDGARVIVTVKFNFVRLKNGGTVRLSPMINRVH